MQNLKPYITYLLLLAIILLLILNMCRKSTEPITVNVNKEVKNYYDSTTKTIAPVIMPTMTSYCLVPVPIDVDTAQILKNYFAIHTYTQSIEDTMIKAVITDTISQNRITGRRFDYRLVKPIRTVESYTFTQRYSGIYAGAYASFGKSSAGFGLQGSYLFKSGKQAQIGYDLINKSIFVGGQVPIKLR